MYSVECFLTLFEKGKKKNYFGKQENVRYKNSPMQPLQKTKQSQKYLC